MKSILQKIIQENEQAGFETLPNEQAHTDTNDNRRTFLKKTTLGGISLAGLMGLSIEDTVAQTTAKVQRSSNPSDLKITDMRCITIDNGTSFTNARNVIIRVDTNQGIYGLGEVRDGADKRYALFLKSRILGKNPCNVEMIFKIINMS